MNLISSGLQAITPPVIALVSLPVAWESVALQRLGGPLKLDGVSTLLPGPPRPAGEIARQLVKLLGSLMSPTQANQGPAGARVPGGPSLYEHGMFHKGAKGAPDSYAFENSPAGVKFAAEHGYSSIDLDMQITKDGVPVNTHWSQPLKKDGFYDPEHKLKPDTKVSEMTFAEVSRLRNKDGQSKIHSMATMMAELKKHNLGGDLEAKDDPRFATPQMMGLIADLVRKNGVRANLKSIDRGERSDRILRQAQHQGFWVRTATGNGHQARNLGYGE